jgi:hypothetical protein
VRLERVRIVPYSGSVAAFLASDRYAQQAYVFSEPIIARTKGADPRCLSIAETGFDPYASVLVTSEALLREHPERVRAVAAASAAGWRRYVDEPDATNERILVHNPEIARRARGGRGRAPPARVRRRGPAVRRGLDGSGTLGDARPPDAGDRCDRGPARSRDGRTSSGSCRRPERRRACHADGRTVYDRRMADGRSRAVVSVIGRDQKGVVARVSTYLASATSTSRTSSSA